MWITVCDFCVEEKGFFAKKTFPLMEDWKI